MPKKEIGRNHVIAEKAVTGFSGADISAVLYMPEFELRGSSFGQLLSDMPPESRDSFTNRGAIAYKLGAIQTITYSIYDEKTPVRSCGFKNPLGVARGNRTIAGSIIFSQLYNHVFEDSGETRRSRVINDSTGILTYSSGSISYILPEKDDSRQYYEQIVNRKHQYDFTWDSKTFQQKMNISEVPPFDIILLYVNEMGNIAKQAIYGVEIVHESGVLSIDDIYTEVTYQYIARDIELFNPTSLDTSEVWNFRSAASPVSSAIAKRQDVALRKEDENSTEEQNEIKDEIAQALEDSDEIIGEEQEPLAAIAETFWEALDPVDRNIVAGSVGLSLSEMESLAVNLKFESSSSFFGFEARKETNINETVPLSRLKGLIERETNYSIEDLDELKNISIKSEGLITDLDSNEWNWISFEATKNLVDNTFTPRTQEDSIDERQAYQYTNDELNQIFLDPEDHVGFTHIRPDNSNFLIVRRWERPPPRAGAGGGVSVQRNRFMQNVILREIASTRGMNSNELGISWQAMLNGTWNKVEVEGSVEILAMQASPNTRQKK